MTTIALIDDDSIHSRLYIDGLRANAFDVMFFERTRSFFDVANDHGKFDIIICDLMMPPDDVFSDVETQNGLLTGLAIAKEVRRKGILCPIILFTNLNLGIAIRLLEREAKKLPDVMVVRKSAINPLELPLVVQGLLDHEMLSENQSRIMRRFFDSLILRPTFFGLGFDLMKLFNPKSKD